MWQKKISNISPYRISTYSVCELYLTNYFLAVTAGRNNIVLHKHQSMSNFLGSIQHTIFRCEIRICLLNVKEQTTQYRIHHQQTGNENNYSYLINKPQLSFCYNLVESHPVSTKGSSLLAQFPQASQNFFWGDYQTHYESPSLLSSRADKYDLTAIL